MLNLTPGTIFYFDPFYFKNGNAAKAKYFIVLATSGDESVLASLPTRKDSVPKELMKEDGCIEDAAINFNCFVFSPSKIVTECGKSFPERTHIYGYQIDTYANSMMSDLYRIEGTDYEFMGTMKKELFDELIDCLVNSRSVRRKYVRMLTK